MDSSSNHLRPLPLNWNWGNINQREVELFIRRRLLPLTDHFPPSPSSQIVIQPYLYLKSSLLLSSLFTQIVIIVAKKFMKAQAVSVLHESGVLWFSLLDKYNELILNQLRELLCQFFSLLAIFQVRTNT